VKIYTKKGDKGTTALIGGKRVSKSHIRIEAYGTVDELNSWLGLIAGSFNTVTEKEMLRKIQEVLFVMGSLLAADPAKAKMKLPEISEDDITLLENEIDRMNEKLPALTAFILPGGTTLTSYCHIARCVCRRAERKTVVLSLKSKVAPIIITYLNRLSDYLFVLARFASHQAGQEEIKWQPRR
jgi:cob(I)alamin adenosyltransferase